MRVVAREYGADVKWNIEDGKLQYPLIQYQETDYDFLKRVLSHLRGKITPDSSFLREGICFYVGIREGNRKGNIDLSQYAHTILLFRNMNRVDTSLKEKQIGYEIADMGYMEVGDMLQIQGQNLYVMEAKSVLESNILNCTCRIFPKECFKAEKISADTLRGAVITGTILETGREKVKLHLDIDREQAVSEAYWFSWKPITGNLFYCMPESGTKVALYFDKNDENDAKVIYNVRTNGDECVELADYNDRYFTTDNGKRMYLKPSEIGLLNMTDQNAGVVIKDASLLSMKTSNQISILAEGQVVLKGKEVMCTAPKEATLMRKNLISPTVINLCNDFDIIGEMGNFISTDENITKKKKVKKSVNNETYNLSGVYEGILSCFPAEYTGDQVTDTVIGGLPIIMNGGKRDE